MCNFVIASQNSLHSLMKRFIFLLFLVYCTLFAVRAQDVIVLHSGESLKVYGVNMGKEFVTYKLMPDDKNRKRISRRKVYSVKKEFGDMVLVTDSVSSLPTYKGEIKRAVSDDNAGIVASYNSIKGGCVGKSAGTRTTARAVAIMGVSSGSVLSNEDVEVEIVPYKRLGMRSMQYRIFLFNKSDVVLHIDLENTFRIFNDGTSRPYFSSQKVSRTKKSERRVSVDRKYSSAGKKGIAERGASIGYGVSVRNSDVVSLSRPVSARRLAVPPRGRVSLPPAVFVSDDGVENRYDYFNIRLDKNDYPLRVWESMTFDEAASPVKNRFIIRYSSDDKFKHYSTVEFSLYLRELIGLGFFTRRVSGDIISNYDERTIFGRAELK